MAQVANVASAIVFVALVAVLVKNKNTSSVIGAFGKIFTESLKIAQGN
jgi:hypothetical protein